MAGVSTIGERLALFFVIDEATDDRLSVHSSRDEADLETRFYDRTASGESDGPLATRAIVREFAFELPPGVAAI